MLKDIIKAISVIIIDVSKDAGNYFEEISGGAVCMIVMTAIDWQYEIIRFTMGVGASIISAYLVHKIKSKFWDKKK